MTRNEYNGWYNYETWLVKLWIDNDEGSYNRWRDAARECVEVDKDQAVRSLAEMLREDHDDQSYDLVESGVFADLLTAALSEVNWEEIASHMIEEVSQAA